MKYRLSPEPITSPTRHWPSRDAKDASARVSTRDVETGEPINDVQVLMLYPNNTYREERTDVFGNADFELHAHLPMTVFCAAHGYCARVVEHDAPGSPAFIELAMESRADGGSQIIANRTGDLAGIEGRLDPILDHLDRTYLYADNVAINDGLTQPVHFRLNEPVRLTDSLGNNATLWFREMRGASCVFDYRLDNARPTRRDGERP